MSYENRYQGHLTGPQLVLALISSPEWSDRVNGVSEAAKYMSNPNVRARLYECLDDSDTAVVSAAVVVLAKFGGVSGMRDILAQLGAATENVGYYIRDTLADVWMEGYPVPDLVRDVLAKVDSSAAVRAGAEQALDALQEL